MILDIWMRFTKAWGWCAMMYDLVMNICISISRDRMDLTVKQNEFVAEIAKEASQKSAYRSAYNTQNLSAKTIWEGASQLSRPPKVDARILELEVEEEARRRMQAFSREDRML